MPEHGTPSRPPRILIASDQNADVRDLEAALGLHGYLVIRVYSATTAPERARAVLPDVIILDARLADRPALELSRELRDDPAIDLNTPILLMAGLPTPQDHLAALRAGIWELFPQPLRVSELLFKLDGYVLAKLEAARAPRAEVLDQETGVYTPQGLARRARQLLFQAGQHNTAAACVVFAPELEDAPGSATPGEQETAALIAQVAELLKTTARRSDAIGRVGPTEFAVVAAGTNGRGAVKLAERFQRAAAQAAAARPGPKFALRAGYNAVSNVRYAPVEPMALVARAVRAAQYAKTEGKWIRESREGS
jgi:diguanylate cyclase (GGDEF)-like protein